MFKCASNFVRLPTFVQVMVLLKCTLLQKNNKAFHEEKVMLPDDDGLAFSSSSTNDTLFFDLPLFSLSCENFDKVCFAPTE